MATYQYKSSAGEVFEIERPMGEAPKSVRVEGVVYYRVYTQPTIRTLSAFERGEKPSVSSQLPTYYGYRQGDKCWREFFQKNGCEDTPANRTACRKAGFGPQPKYIERRSREAAAKAGALDRFSPKGQPIARSKREVGRNLDTAKKLGDSLEWS